MQTWYQLLASSEWPDSSQNMRVAKQMHFLLKVERNYWTMSAMRSGNNIDKFWNCAFNTHSVSFESQVIVKLDLPYFLQSQTVYCWICWTEGVAPRPGIEQETSVQFTATPELISMSTPVFLKPYSASEGVRLQPVWNMFNKSAF